MHSLVIDEAGKVRCRHPCFSVSRLEFVGEVCMRDKLLCVREEDADALREGFPHVYVISLSFCFFFFFLSFCSLCSFFSFFFFLFCSIFLGLVMGY